MRKGLTSYTWDQYGNVLTGTSPYGTTTTNAYSYASFSLGELTSVKEGTKSATTYTYYEPSGLAHTIVSPLPGTVGNSQTVTTTYNWDALGNPTSEITPGNNSVSSITTSYGYTTDGSYNQAEALGEPLTVTDNLGHVSHARYDQRSNKAESIDALGNETDQSYNLADQPLTTTFPATGQTGPGRATETISYLYPDGPSTAAAWFDESGIQVRQATAVYGKEGELLSRTGSVEPFTQVLDGFYRLVQLKDGNNNATSYLYGVAGYLSSITYPGGDSVQIMARDYNGNVLSRTDGNNVQTNYTYADPESVLTDIQYPASPAINVHLSYDGYGRRVSMSDGTGSESTSYDDLDNELSVSTTYTGLPVRTLSYSYYPSGDRSQMSTPAGTFSYSYDADARSNSLSNPFGETFSWTYLDNGWPLKQALANGAYSLWTYNARGMVNRLQNLKADNTTLSDFGGAGGLTYDALGNLLGVNATIPVAPSAGGSTSFQYSSQDQLTSEQSSRVSGYTFTFGYDAAFNPTTFKGGVTSFNSNNQSTAFTFDHNGNPTSYRGNALSWDTENRLTAYGTMLTAGYTGDGDRAWKQNAAGTRTYFLYDGSNPVCELDNQGNVVATNTFGAYGLLSRHTPVGSTFYAFDTQNNVAERLDSGGNTTSYDVLDAFGNLLGGSIPDPWGYNAQNGSYTDIETGLLALSRRYYDPTQGRFLNRDPDKELASVNLYCYVNDNPSNWTDPDGTVALEQLPRTVNSGIAVVTGGGPSPWWITWGPRMNVCMLVLGGILVPVPRPIPRRTHPLSRRSGLRRPGTPRVRGTNRRESIARKSHRLTRSIGRATIRINMMQAKDVVARTVEGSVIAPNPVGSGPGDDGIRRAHRLHVDRGYLGLRPNSSAAELTLHKGYSEDGVKGISLLPKG